MVENQSRAMLILAGVVVIIVLAASIQKLKPIEQEAQETGAKLAKVWMQESVQRYHQAWLVHGEPKQLFMDGFKLTMTEGGLVSPFKSSDVLDCDYWLMVHYPQRKIMASELLEIRGAIKSNSYTCQYTYENGQRVIVILDANYLKIDVETLTE
ncbi:MSHA biogenesis protein MshF [Vibrio campbellii]|uniref:MSHA biogenesis protein MshF n=1 Tax=Vibrio campbellii TaxID=680 RepID=UPI00210CE927|nr:MSHA biogenesis protein MshF [Vibrio campbellii]UTZ42337.1 MSHA biogenesis protein MshF [Vibrio campbellii]